MFFAIFFIKTQNIAFFLPDGARSCSVGDENRHGLVRYITRSDYSVGFFADASVHKFAHRKLTECGMVCASDNAFGGRQILSRAKPDADDRNICTIKNIEDGCCSFNSFIYRQRQISATE